MKSAPRKPFSPLSARHQRFCELIAAGESGTDAYLQAGWKSSRAAARANASKLLTKANIQARVTELRKPVTRAILLTKDRKRELLRDIAEDTTEAVLSRIRAIEVDSKLAGHFEPDRTEIDVGSQTLLSIKERAAQVVSALARS